MPDVGDDLRTPEEIAAEALDFVRARKRAEDPDLGYLVAHADGVVEGLEAAGAFTSKEAGVWRRRISELMAATGEEGADLAISLGRSRQEVGPPPPPRFVRLAPGPAESMALLDGRVRIVAVELFLDRLRLHWNIGPLPSFEAVMGDDLAALDQDTTGLEPKRQSLVRDSAFNHRLHLLAEFTLADDVGTEYRYRQGHGTGGARGEEWFGSHDFSPAPPQQASELIVVIGTAQFRVLLPSAS